MTSWHPHRSGPVDRLRQRLAAALSDAVAFECDPLARSCAVYRRGDEVTLESDDGESAVWWQTAPNLPTRFTASASPEFRALADRQRKAGRLP
jgi:hypothetical protein